MSNLGNKQIMANNIRYYMNIHSVSQTEICNTLGFKMPTSLTGLMLKLTHE